jgi:hypothetical protein
VGARSIWSRPESGAARPVIITTNGVVAESAHARDVLGVEAILESPQSDPSTEPGPPPKCRAPLSSSPTLQAADQPPPSSHRLDCEMLFTDVHASVARVMRAKLLTIFEGQAARIRQAAGRRNMARGISQPNRRDLAYPVTSFPEKTCDLARTTDGLPIHSRDARPDLLMHELLRREDIQSVLSQEPDAQLDVVFRRPQNGAAILRAREGDHGRQPGGSG